MKQGMQSELIYATNVETIRATRTIASGLVETRDLGTGHQLVRATFPAGEDWIPGCAEIVLAHVRAGRFTMVRDIGAGLTEAQWQPGQILLTPDHAPGISRWPGSPPISTLEIGFTAPALSRAAGELYGKDEIDLEPLCHAPLEDTLISQALLSLWGSDAVVAPPRLLTEQCVELILLQLVRRAFERRRPAPKSGRTALAPWALKRVIDLIEARLGEDIGLAELAGAARLSPSHFARAFKLTTGVAPYRYVLTRRVHRALALLADTGLPIIEVAARCGYSDPGHFATLFRRETGYTPRQYRKAAGDA